MTNFRCNISVFCCNGACGSLSTVYEIRKCLMVSKDFFAVAVKFIPTDIARCI